MAYVWTTDLEEEAGVHEPNQISLAAKASGEPAFREVGVGPWAKTHPGRPRPDDPASPDYDARFDSALLAEGDRRNVLDRYRYWSVDAIKADLDAHGRHDFEVAVENWTHDFNIGSMVRTANAFQAKRVHIVGPHKWNRKGALMTELYQHVEHHPSITELVECWRNRIAGEIAYERARAGAAATTAEIAAAGARIGDLQEARVIALDIIDGAVPMETYQFPQRCLLLFGAEGPGLSEKALELADDVVYISQFGSVRSINAGAAAAVAMHAWIAQHARIS
jgi:tRNA G18 (ribose-2'-O)-methylase SpoU